MIPCKLCNHDRFETVYSGPIRASKFDTVTEQPFNLRRCLGCLAIAIADAPEDLHAHYASGEYRAGVDGAADSATFFRLHDDAQPPRLTAFGLARFRDKVVADIGCGGGAFLDAIHGVIRRGVAVEPDTSFHADLAARGYDVFPSIKDAVGMRAATMDVVVTFEVLEHIDNPLIFLQEIRALLRPTDGRLFLSTPNVDDALLTALPEVYSRFFYRIAHLWYFNPQSLTHLLQRAGFQDIKMIPFQQFGLGNFLGWLRDKAPQGHLSLDYVTTTTDAVWRAELERTWRCSHIFVEATST